MTEECYFCKDKVEADSNGNINLWWHQDMRMTFDRVVCVKCAKIINSKRRTNRDVKNKKQMTLHEFENYVWKRRGLETHEEREMRYCKNRIKELKSLGVK